MTNEKCRQIYTSWLALRNAIHFEKIQKRFPKMWSSEYNILYTFFQLADINRHISVKTRNNF